MKKWYLDCPYDGTGACDNVLPVLAIKQTSGDLIVQGSTTISDHIFGIFKTQVGAVGNGNTTVDNCYFVNNRTAGIFSDNLATGTVSVRNNTVIELPYLLGQTPQMFKIDNDLSTGYWGVGINGHNTSVPITIDRTTIEGVPSFTQWPDGFKYGAIWKGGLTATNTFFNFNYDGVLLLGGGNNSISNCTFNTMARNAINVETTTVPDIRANTFTNNPTGIYVKAAVPGGSELLILKASCNLFDMGNQTAATGILVDLGTSTGAGLIAGGAAVSGIFPGGANVFPVVNTNIAQPSCYSSTASIKYDIECNPTWSFPNDWVSAAVTQNSQGSVNYYRFNNEFVHIPLSSAISSIASGKACFVGDPPANYDPTFMVKVCDNSPVPPTGFGPLARQGVKNDPSPTAISGSEETEIKVYPIPVQNTLFIEGLALGTSYQLIDIVGKVAATGVKNQAGVLGIDCRALPASSYQIVINSRKSENSHIRFHVQH